MPAREQVARWGAPVLLAGLLGVAVYLLVRPAWQPAAPSPEQWLEAAQYVQERWQPGDGVRLEPTWLTAGRVYFGDVDGGPRTPFRVLDLHAPVDPAFLYTFDRLWLVSAVEARDSWEDSVPPGAELEEEWHNDAVTVRRFAIPPDVVRWAMVPNLRNARVERVDEKGRPVHCKRRAATHRCGLKGHLDVKEELRRVAGSARQCVLVHAGPGKNPTTLRFPGLRGPGSLLVRLGNTVEAARSKNGGTVHAEVRLDGDVIGSLDIERRAYRLDEIRHALTDAAEKELVILLRATDDKKREICLDGYVLGAPFAP